MSYSSLSRYEECPRSYYLGRIKNAEQKMTWFFPIGTAVHQMIEHAIEHPEANWPTAEEVFYPLVEAQMKVDPVDVNWLSGGSQDDPVIREKALDLVKRCFENALAFLEDMDVWEVEYEATGMLPGCEVPIKAFVDLIGEHKKHGPSIVDWKTGKQKPKNNLQLETYHALIMEGDSKYSHVGDFVGLWGMLNPEASSARLLKGLAEVDHATLGARYQKAYEAIKGKQWKATHGFHCRFCTQAPNCLIESGPTKRALYYDKSEEEGFPF